MTTEIKISIDTIAENSKIDKTIIMEIITRYKEDFLVLGELDQSGLNTLQFKYLTMYFEFFGKEPEIIDTGRDLNECKADCIHLSFKEWYKVEGESWFTQGYVIIKSFKNEAEY